jgi:hypothetical protein
VTYCCSYDRIREDLLTGFITCMAESMGPYSCWFCRIWRAYAESGFIVSDVSDMILRAVLQAASGLAYVLYVAFEGVDTISVVGYRLLFRISF